MAKLKRGGFLKQTCFFPLSILMNGNKQMFMYDVDGEMQFFAHKPTSETDCPPENANAKPMGFNIMYVNSHDSRQYLVQQKGEEFRKQWIKDKGYDFTTDESGKKVANSESKIVDCLKEDLEYIEAFVQLRAIYSAAVLIKEVYNITTDDGKALTSLQDMVDLLTDNYHIAIDLNAFAAEQSNFLRKPIAI